MDTFHKVNNNYIETPLRHNKIISSDDVLFNISFDTFASYSEEFKKIISDIVDFKEPIKIYADEETLELFLNTFHRGSKNIKITEIIAYKIAILSLQWNVHWNICKAIILNSSPNDKQLDFLYSNDKLSELASELILRGVEYTLQPSLFKCTYSITYFKDRERYYVNKNLQLLNTIDYLKKLLDEEKIKQKRLKKNIEIY